MLNAKTKRRPVIVMELEDQSQKDSAKALAKKRGMPVSVFCRSLLLKEMEEDACRHR